MGAGGGAGGLVNKGIRDILFINQTKGTRWRVRGSNMMAMVRAAHEKVWAVIFIIVA